jgi:hypothetical protein
MKGSGQGNAQGKGQGNGNGSPFSDHPGASNENRGNMQEKEANVSTSYYEYGGEAFALGEDTFTMVDSTSTIVDRGPVTTARINIKATAVATSSEGDFTYASSSTYVESNCDISVLLNFEEGSLNYDGVSYDISKAKFIGICLPDHVNLPGGSKNKVIIIEHEGDPDLDVALDGNVAMLSLSAQVEGENTYLSAEAYVLAVEDTISYSALAITAAVA